MGLLDAMTGALGGAVGGQTGQGQMMQAVMSLIDKAGGIDGLLARLREGGLGDVVSSWLSPGENRPVSGAQLEGALGSDLLGPLARQTGMGQGELASGLAGMLPQLIDRLSPDGQPPAGGAMPDLGGLLGSLLSR